MEPARSRSSASRGAAWRCSLGLALAGAMLAGCGLVSEGTSTDPAGEVLPTLDAAADVASSDHASEPDAGAPDASGKDASANDADASQDTAVEPEPDADATSPPDAPADVPTEPPPPCGHAGEACCSGPTACINGRCDSGTTTCHTCAPAMVWTGAVCIDRYEASLDSTQAAQSVAGAVPAGNIDRPTAASACAAAGKRLCTAAEWGAACGGPQQLAFPYGASFAVGVCNDQNSPTSCTKAGDGVKPTGTSGCTSQDLALEDMSGNVWEWVSDQSGSSCSLAGGSVDSCRDSTKLACSTLGQQPCSLKWPALGFRCCADP